MKKKLIVLGCVGLVWIMTSFLFELGIYKYEYDKTLGLLYGCMGIVYIVMIVLLGYVFVFIPEKNL